MTEELITSEAPKRDFYYSYHIECNLVVT